MKRAYDDVTQAPPAKKPRGAASHIAAVALVNSILANPKGYPIAANEDAVRKSLVSLASYARHLEQQLGIAASSPPVAGSSKAAAAPAGVKPARSKAELDAAADKLRRAAVSGITKQMAWKPTCKLGTAKWSYDGICTDPEVFGALMNLGGPPKFKMKKMSVDEFERCLGRITGSVRYDTLYITSKEVIVRWSETGEFRFSGSYGKYQG